MIMSITTNQRIGIFKDGILIALLDDMGVPIITPKFFGLSEKDVKRFWLLVNNVKVDY